MVFQPLLSCTAMDLRSVFYLKPLVAGGVDSNWALMLGYDIAFWAGPNKAVSISSCSPTLNVHGPAGPVQIGSPPHPKAKTFALQGLY
jgi:hypothetical protein